MKIAIFSDTFLPQINGVTKTLGKMKEYMDANKIQYRFFIPGEESETHTLGQMITFQSINFFLYPECKIALPNYREVKQQLDAFKPDLIHIATPFSVGLTGLKYGRESNIPITCSYHTDFPAYLRHYNISFLEGALWKYFQWFHSFGSMNFAPSKETIRQLQENGIQNLEIWGRGIETDLFSPESRSLELRNQYCREEEILLLYVGRLAPEKELDILMEAAEYLNRKHIKFKLLLVGDGPSRRILEGKKVPNVLFAGYRSGEELRTLYATADIFVFPSSTETYGNVILEAMASGLPVVAPYAGGIKENLIHRYNGLACKTGDGIDMGKKIERLMQLQTRYILAENARKHAMTRSWAEVFRGLFQKYEQIIGHFYQNKIHLSA